MKLHLTIEADELRAGDTPAAVSVTITPLVDGLAPLEEGDRVRTVDLTADEDGFLPVLPPSSSRGGGLR